MKHLTFRSLPLKPFYKAINTVNNRLHELHVHEYVHYNTPSSSGLVQFLLSSFSMNQVQLQLILVDQLSLIQTINNPRSL